MGGKESSEEEMTADIQVQWSDEDDGYIATCKEFPSLSYWHAESARARDGLARLISDIESGEA